MRRSITLLCMLAGALVAMPQGADAQSRPQTHDGFFIGLVFGGGTFGCEACGGREGPLTGYLKLGGALNPQLRLGVESSAWTKDENGARLTHATSAPSRSSIPRQRPASSCPGASGSRGWRPR
jgi:hypothetical protein